MEKKVLTKRCKFCGKEIRSMYKKQLDYNIQAHEISCKRKIMEETNNKIKGGEK